jgi:AmpE protein
VVIPAQLALLLLSIALHGLVGHFLLSLFIIWYSLGLDRFKREASDKPEQVLLLSYHEVFAVIFWYSLIGPLGAALYYTLGLLQRTLEQDAEQKTLLAQLNQVIGVMDWVPVRLMGISYALVGHFSTLFPLWLKDLRGDLLENEERLLDWGNKAIELSKTEDSTAVESANLLVERSVVVWLVALALISVGYWIG